MRAALRVALLPLVLLALMAGCAGASITVSIKNDSGLAIQSITASYTGGVARFGPLGVNESQEIQIRPTGDSHLELEIQPAQGSAQHRVVDTYFERGYRGKIQITLDSSFTPFVITKVSP